MPRYIVRFRGEGSKPADVVDRIRSLPDTRIVDEDSPRMLLVEAPDGALHRLLEGSDWLVAEQRTYRTPEQRPSVQAPPKPPMGQTGQ